MTDRKRLSKEKHEIAYVRKLARDTLVILKTTTDVAYVNEYSLIPGRKAAVQRLCKAVLKFAK